MDSKRPFYQLVIGWLVVVTVITAIALLRPSPVLSDVNLTQAVNSAFLPRTEDPALHDLAHQRAIEASVNFSHAGATMAEVLAWNQGFADPVSTVITQWLESPAHLAILSDPNLTAIGCGSVTTADGRYFAACVLSAGEPVEVARTPNPQPVGAVPTAGATPIPAVVALPNTAQEEP